MSEPTASAARPPIQTLPGETEEEANLRVSLTCFREHGLTVSDPGPDGGYEIAGASAREMVAISETCQQRLEALGLQGDYALSDDELNANFDRISAYRACIAAQGYDIGQSVSRQEFIASGGTIDLFVGVAEVLQTLSAAERTRLQAACPD